MVKSVVQRLVKMISAVLWWWSLSKRRGRLTHTRSTNVYSIQAFLHIFPVHSVPIADTVLLVGQGGKISQGGFDEA